MRIAALLLHLYHLSQLATAQEEPHPSSTRADPPLLHLARPTSLQDCGIVCTFLLLYSSFVYLVRTAPVLPCSALTIFSTSLLFAPVFQAQHVFVERSGACLAAILE